MLRRRQAGAAQGPPPSRPRSHPRPRPRHRPAVSATRADAGSKVLGFLPCDGEVALPEVALEQLFADPAAATSASPSPLTGPLVKRGAECTEGECERTCCNTCVSVVTIGDADSGRYVHLVSPETPGLYLCRGDESLLCCQFKADGQTVVAQGTFQVTTGMTPPVYQLFATELCTESTAPPDVPDHLAAPSHR